MYFLLKSILFQFDPEKVHYLVTRNLKRFNRVPGGAALIRFIWQVNDPRLRRDVFGIKFKNPVGLAAGFDKNAEVITEMANLGFGFVEVGTVTPLPQDGNPKPRMFRLPKDAALINRMGFNNLGVEAVAQNIALYRKNAPSSQKGLIIGGNIGKNKATPNEEAVNDYIKCFDGLYELVDYFVVNVSSPNTPGLRELQEKKPLMQLLDTLQKRNVKTGAPKPILLKIAPDLENSHLDDIIDIVQQSGIAGIIAANTTLERKYLNSPDEMKNEAGGLSGRPLSNRSAQVIRYISEKSHRSFPIVGVGGIHSADDALYKLKAGASLVQLYTGFIYEGPGLISEINRKLLQELS